jgi:predicted nucleic acid-binding protein
MILVDTSVWVDHFKTANEQLVALLQAGQILCHPSVVVEIACGTPPNRREVLEMLSLLESAPVATHEELLTLVAERALHGRGIGLVDLSLLAATLLAGGTALWTLDKRLEAVASELGCCWRPGH